MTIIANLTTAVKNDVPVTSVCLKQLGNEQWTVSTSRQGHVTLQLGKTIKKAMVWPIYQTQRFRSFKAKKGKLGSGSTVNMNTAQVHISGLGWVPMKSMPTTLEQYRKCLKVPGAPTKKATTDPSTVASVVWDFAAKMQQILQC